MMMISNPWHCTMISDLGEKEKKALKTLEAAATTSIFSDVLRGLAEKEAYQTSRYILS